MEGRREADQYLHRYIIAGNIFWSPRMQLLTKFGTVLASRILLDGRLGEDHVTEFSIQSPVSQWEPRLQSGIICKLPGMTTNLPINNDGNASDNVWEPQRMTPVMHNRGHRCNFLTPSGLPGSSLSRLASKADAAFVRIHLTALASNILTYVLFTSL
jgi:hypothetical protein